MGQGGHHQPGLLAQHSRARTRAPTEPRREAQAERASGSDPITPEGPILTSSRKSSGKLGRKGRFGASTPHWGLGTPLPIAASFFRSPFARREHFSSSSRRIPPGDLSLSESLHRRRVAHFLSYQETAGPSGNSKSASPRRNPRPELLPAPPTPRTNLDLPPHSPASQGVPTCTFRLFSAAASSHTPQASSASSSPRPLRFMAAEEPSTPEPSAHHCSHLGEEPRRGQRRSNRAPTPGRGEGEATPPRTLRTVRASARRALSLSPARGLATPIDQPRPEMSGRLRLYLEQSYGFVLRLFVCLVGWLVG